MARQRPAWQNPLMTDKARKRRGPRKATPKHLENAALHYLGRFATSAENLRRVLTRKVDRSARTHGTDRAEGRVQVESLIRRFVASGLVDDLAYARARASSLARRGASARLIRARLLEKGVDPEAVAAALAALADDGGDAELRAAVNLARRRRLGPFRKRIGGQARDEREKALAALARAGFSYDVAKRVIDAESADALEEAAGG
jgi:regulatory protein